MDVRKIPSIDSLVREIPDVSLKHAVKVRLARRVVSQLSRKEDVEKHEFVTTLRKECNGIRRMRKVINATGIVLHTNLGRAPLGESLTHLVSEMSGYCDLEQEAGLRIDRTMRARNAIQLLVGGEDSLIVNNNASALLISLHTMAKDHDAIVSRGELVQIGGGFRIPDILEVGGATLMEVGTTNITTLRDYEKKAKRAKVILKVNPSNFQITGHVQTVELKELSTLSKRHHVALLYDEGSGDLMRVERALKLADVVCFSTDKLLGASQAGIIVGRKSLISSMRKSPLYRALRVGKLDLFCLEVALWRKLAGEATETDLLLNESLERIQKRAERLAHTIERGTVVVTWGAVGGGSRPEEKLESFGVEIHCDENDVSSRLLNLNPPIIVRKGKGRIWMDARTIFDQDVDAVARSVKGVLSCSS